MSVTPGTAPFRPAYARDAAGLYYRIGGGGGGTGGAVYVGLLADDPDPADYSQWVVTDNPAAYTLQVSDGTTWYPIAGGGGGGGEGERPTAAFTYTKHWSDVSVNGTTSTDTDGFITTYDWDWGDGTTHGTGATASHTYATSGDQNITLRVTDNDANQHQVMQTVSVTRMYGPVTFTTKGATFGPKLWQVADTTNAIEWINDATSTVVGTGPTPTINFGSAGTRTIRMHCSRPQDVLTVNVGYNTSHDTGNYLPGASGGASANAGDYTLAPQRISAVSGLQVLPNLVNFMAAGNPDDPTLTTADRLGGFVDFSGLSKLEFIECAYARISSTNLTGCTSLIRLCFEENNFQGNTLDLNPVRTNLKDIRMAFQGGVTFTPLTGPLTQLYHLCVRAQPITNMPKVPNIPAVTEHWTWANQQTGTFVVPPLIFDARVDDNSYTSIDLTLTPGTPSIGRLAASRNPLTSITGLATGRRFSLLELLDCNMTQTLVNQILANVNSWGTSNGGLHLTGSASPTGGQNNTDRLALVSRGWTVVVA